MTLWLVRHGQSTVNAGAQSDMDAPLTELGWQQARSLADAVGQQPDLVITSPLLRARQTAMPWLERWPATPQEIWPIQEFVYLSPARWKIRGTQPVVVGASRTRRLIAQEFR